MARPSKLTPTVRDAIITSLRAGACIETAAEAELDAVHGIRGAWLTHWQAAAWYLERSHPERWGRRVIASESQSGGSFLVQLHNMASRMRIGEDE